MSLGERGGVTVTLEDGMELIETYKADLAAAVRADILDHLDRYPEWHANDLRVDVTGHSNVVGATVNGLARTGLIVKTGEWRPATAVASHGRESRVWRLARGCGDGRSLDQPAVISPSGDGGGNGLDEPVPAPLFVLDPDPPVRPGIYDREDQ